MTATQRTFVSGFAVIIGPPNAGKSTLLNALLGEKISITSQRPQTTRNRILGVVHRPFSQLVFIDTPGIHRSRSLFNQKMVEDAVAALNDADLILTLADAEGPDPDSEDILVQALRKTSKPAILGLNKIDAIPKQSLLPVIRDWAGRYPFREIVPISARTGEQLEELLVAIEALLPESPPLFPSDTLTDASEKFIVAELIREKIFRMTSKEIPYSTAVTIDSFKTNKTTGVLHIGATIHVERDSQKGILIGKGGSRLKSIGASARQDIERLMGIHVFLKLFVRVEKNWSSDAQAIRRLGYR